MATKIIQYKCLCNETLDIVPDYAKYLIEYMDIERKAKISCPNCNRVIPIRKIYKSYLKERGGEKK